MPRNNLLLTVVIVCSLLPALRARPAAAADGAVIPLAEHPRPDFERADWLNLNGPWSFRFDPKDEGEQGGWSSADLRSFPLRITVPFPWGSELSGVADEADIGWYARALR